MVNKGYNSIDYSYGYQGSEKDNEVNSGMYTTEFRALDVRLGRWFGTDAITQPWQSSYTSMDNNPIANVDKNGAFVIDKRLSPEDQAKIRSMVSAAWTMLQNDPKVRTAFFSTTGFKTLEEVKNNLFEEGNGPKLSFAKTIEKYDATAITNSNGKKIYVDELFKEDGDVGDFYGGWTLLHESVHAGRIINKKDAGIETLHDAVQNVGKSLANKALDETKRSGYDLDPNEIETGVLFEVEVLGYRPRPRELMKDPNQPNLGLDGQKVGAMRDNYLNLSRQSSTNYLNFKLNFSNAMEEINQAIGAALSGSFQSTPATTTSCPRF